MRKRNPMADWTAVIVNYLGRKCTYCGSTKGLHIHHIIPRYLGGKNELGNLEMVCWEHHKDLHREIIKLFPTKKQTKKEEVCICCGNMCIYVSGSKASKDGQLHYCHTCNRIFPVFNKISTNKKWLVCKPVPIHQNTH